MGAGVSAADGLLYAWEGRALDAEIAFAGAAIGTVADAGAARLALAAARRGIAIGREALGTGRAAEGLAPYAVGTYDALKARSVVGDALDIHHVVQANPAGQMIPGYLRVNGPSISLPEAEHALIPRLSGSYTGTARDLLARDVRNLRNFTNTPNDALWDLIDLNKQMYPGAFPK